MPMRFRKVLALCLLVGGVLTGIYFFRQYQHSEFSNGRSQFEKEWLTTYSPSVQLTLRSTASPFYEQLATSALAQTRERVAYDPSYVKIPYPGGDVPRSTGVCADVVIRAYRDLSLDLQMLVHEDMQKHFNLYPKLWGLSATDTNIDHRRVPNLMIFFSRFGEKLKISNVPSDFEPGDLVTWMIGGKLPHIGIVSNKRSDDGNRFKIIHNIGAGPQLEDRLFNWPMTGHFRYIGSLKNLS